MLVGKKIMEKGEFKETAKQSFNACGKENLELDPWYDGHSISISACGVWGVKAEVQVSRRKLRIHIYLDYVRVEFYLISKKKKKVYF